MTIGMSGGSWGEKIVKVRVSGSKIPTPHQTKTSARETDSAFPERCSRESSVSIRWWDSLRAREFADD